MHCLTQVATEAGVKGRQHGRAGDLGEAVTSKQHQGKAGRVFGTQGQNELGGVSDAPHASQDPAHHRAYIKICHTLRVARYDRHNLTACCDQAMLADKPLGIYSDSKHIRHAFVYLHRPSHSQCWLQQRQVNH